MNHSASDVITSLNGATIQHGSYNQRIYLMDLGRADPGKLARKLICLAGEKGYSKIFAKVPDSQASPFLVSGFRLEAEIPFFYPGEGARFLGYYLESKRRHEPDSESLDELVTKLVPRKQNRPAKPLPEKIKIRRCTPEDAEAMAAIYRSVFPTYPFPIFDPQYLRQSMANQVDFFCVEQANRLLALSSMEKDGSAKNVEMTDFATPAKHRGKDFARHLLARMEREMLLKKYRLAYTIARAKSPAMNLTFARLGYVYAGRLANNTNISGKIESMNVWYKKIRGSGKTHG